MNAKRNLCLLAAFAGFTLSAFAQLDAPRFASDLRTKYGPPLARETYTARPGIQMVVDYAANGHVCSIQLPPVALGREPNVRTAQAIDEFLLELVPLSVRGKELGGSSMAVGAPSVSSIDYENVIITVSFRASRRTGVAVTFRNEECRKADVR
jgi:hypothetical protein